MNPADNEQTELLRHIWNEMKALGTNLGGRIDALGNRIDAVRVELKGELKETNIRLDRTIARLDQTIDRLDQTIIRVDETNTRLGTVEEVLHELAAQQVMLGRYVKHTSQRAIDELRDRVSRIEDVLKLGPG